MQKIKFNPLVGNVCFYMRAREYLEINKSKIQYYEIVKSAIDDLSLLRNNKRKTTEYFNKHLFSDARYIAQEEGYVPREGEIDESYVYDIRMCILNAVCHDESFIYAFNIIVMQSNKYYEFLPLTICKIKEINCNTISYIENICSQYKEDYPKSNLIGFLHDSLNAMYYEFNQHNLNKDEEWWLYAFNQAYAIFGEMRLQLHEPFKALELVKQYKNDDKELEFTVKDIVSRIVCEYKLDSMSDELQNASFGNEMATAGKEAHWNRDKNVRDVLVHLYEWHQLLLNWVNANCKGEVKPFLPEPYNWKTYPTMNVEFLLLQAIMIGH